MIILLIILSNDHIMPVDGKEEKWEVMTGCMWKRRMRARPMEGTNVADGKGNRE